MRSLLEKTGPWPISRSGICVFDKQPREWTNLLTRSAWDCNYGNLFKEWNLVSGSATSAMFCMALALPSDIITRIGLCCQTKPNMFYACGNKSVQIMRSREASLVPSSPEFWHSAGYYSSLKRFLSSKFVRERNIRDMQILTIIQCINRGEIVKKRRSYASCDKVDVC